MPPILINFCLNFVPIFAPILSGAHLIIVRALIKVIHYFSGDSFAISSDLVAHATTKHFYTDVKFSLGTIDHFHFIAFACVAQTNKAFETLAHI